MQGLGAPVDRCQSRGAWECAATHFENVRNPRTCGTESQVNYKAVTRWAGRGSPERGGQSQDRPIDRCAEMGSNTPQGVRAENSADDRAQVFNNVALLQRPHTFPQMCH